MKALNLVVITILIVLSGATVTGGVPVSVEETITAQTTLDLTIAYTHDMHSHLYSTFTDSGCEGGMDRLATKVQELRDSGPLLLFDCGDAVSGGAVGDLNGGIPVIEAMNSISYDAMAIDNHEFDQGLRVLEDMISAADFEVLSCNTEWSGTVQPADYSIEVVDGYKIGVVGLTQSFWYAPESVTFHDMSASATQAVNELESQDVDFIILLGCVSSSLANSVPNVDLIVKGGGPTYVGDTLSLPSVGSYTTELGVVRITIDTTTGTIDTYSFSSVDLDSSVEANSTILDLIDSYDATLAEYIDKPVGYFSEAKSRAELGTILSTALKERYNADAGIYNGGGVRDSIDAGFVTYRDLYHVEPFFNYATTIDVPGWLASQIISSHYYYTEIAAFQSDTIYTIACSNFSAAAVERLSGTDITNRQNFLEDTVVEVLAEYLSTQSNADAALLNDALTRVTDRIEGLPASQLTGSDVAAIKANMISTISQAKDAITAGDDTTATNLINEAILTLSNNLKRDCSLKWLETELRCVLYYLEPMPPNTGPYMLPFIVGIAVIGMVIVVGIVYRLRANRS